MKIMLLDDLKIFLESLIKYKQPIPEAKYDNSTLI